MRRHHMIYLILLTMTAMLFLLGVTSVFSAGSAESNQRLNAAAGPIQSDDFDTCTLASFWTFEPGQPGDPAPVFNGRQMLLTAPGGAYHNIWTKGIHANRIVQSLEAGDFEVEVKFASQMDSRYQTRGIIVEDASGNALRFEVFHDGWSYHLFGGSVIDGTTTPYHNVTIGNDNPIYMRVGRVGDTWTHSYSLDGTIWESKSFDLAFAGNRIGPYAGNSTNVTPGDEPEHTAIFDYFYNTAAPGPGDSGAALHTLVANTSGSGTITKDPDQATYGCNQVVTLTAVPDPGWQFNGWSGDLIGSANPLALTMNNDKVVTATFVKLPLEHTLTVNTVGSGSVTVDPEQELYAEGAMVTLTPEADPGWEFSGWSGDAVGIDNPLIITMDGDKSITATFEENPSGIMSDDFDTCTLASFWTFKPGQAGDPPPGFNGTQMILKASAGSNHAIDAGGIHANRVVQPLNDEDFEVEVKFASQMDLQFQSRGIIVEDAAGNALRFETLFDGTTYNLAGGSVIAGVEVTYYSEPISGGNPLYMRLSRAGNTWTHSYSQDGTTWSMESFDLAFTASNIGPYAGNAAETPGSEPQHVALIDYFYNTTFPGAGDNGADTYDLIINMAGSGSVAKAPAQGTYGCGQVVILTAVPDPGWQFNGWSGDLTGNANPLALTMNGDKVVTATFSELPPITYNLTVDTVGGGTVTIIPDQTGYAPDTLVTLTPVADPGWVFSGWSGDASGSDDPLEITMDGDKTITATFVGEKTIFLPVILVPTLEPNS
jgi:uncharacterized repeat protein (TIGR02543 family)